MKKIFLPIIVLSLALLGCIVTSALPGASKTGQAPAGATLSSQPGQGVTPDLTNAVLPHPETGLDGLNSYHQELEVTFQGTSDGQPANSKQSTSRDFWKQPATVFTVLQNSDANGQKTLILNGAQGDAHYYQPGSDQPCQVKWGKMASASDTELNPARLLPPIVNAKEAGTETISGVSAKHYTVNGSSGNQQSSGEFWLAEQGGYLLKYTLTMKLSEQAPGKGLAGEQTYTYELSQVNSQRDVTLPKGCPPVLMDVPVMSDAKNLNRNPQSVGYTSPSSLDQASGFYEAEMKKAGWELLPIPKGDSKSLTLSFRKDAEQKIATVFMAVEDNGGVWVNVQVRQEEAQAPAGESTPVPASPSGTIPGMPTFSPEILTMMPPQAKTMMAQLKTPTP